VPQPVLPELAEKATSLKPGNNVATCDLFQEEFEFRFLPLHKFHNRQSGPVSNAKDADCVIDQGFQDKSWRFQPTPGGNAGAVIGSESGQDA
jgi:hypothetical protein